MVAQNLNTNTYVIAIDNSSKSVQLTPQDTNQSTLIIYNDSTNPVFVVTGKGAAPTAVFPTTSNDPLAGKVIPSKQSMNFQKTAFHDYVAAIQATSGTGNLYISIGSGGLYQS